MRELDYLFEKLKPILGAKIDTLWLAYQLEDYEGRKEISDVIHLLSQKYLDETFTRNKILLQPPDGAKIKGEYFLGHILYGDKPVSPFYLAEQQLTEHVAIFGRSGSGKTNVGYLIVANMLKRNKPFMIFDFKRDFRDFIALPEFKGKMLYFTIGRGAVPFYFNPLIPPPQITPTEWVKEIIEIFCHAFFEGQGVFYLLLKAFDHLYTQFGIYNNAAIYPTVKDVFNYIENYPTRGRETWWKASALRALGSLSYGEIGRTLSIRRRYPFEFFLNQNVVFELDGLTEADRIFFIEALLLWIHHYRLQEGRRGEFKHAIIIEEAQGILNKKKEEITGLETITEKSLREMRELGESIIYLSQNPSLISKTALGNTFCIISLNLSHQTDINLAADCLLLNYEEKSYLSQIKVGEGIVKLQDKWTKPFLVKFPQFKIQKGIVTDSDLRAAMIGLLKKYEFLKRGEEEKSVKFVNTGEEKEKEPKKGDLEDEELLLLEDILNNPLSGIYERKNRLEMSPYQIRKLKDDLVSKGLIEVNPINKGNARMKLLSLSKEGVALMQKRGYVTTHSRRTGDVVHMFWEREIAKLLREKGFEVVLEKGIGGGNFTDIVADKNQKKIAIEIETGKSDMVYNITKNLDKGFDSVVSVVLDKVAENRIKRYAADVGLDKDARVKILGVNEFLKVVKG